MMQEIFDIILRMSMQGTVIFAIVFVLRFLLKKLHIAHKYIVVLWMILFFYLVFPWKLEMQVGFWNYDAIEDWNAENTTTSGENEVLDNEVIQTMPEMMLSESMSHISTSNGDIVSAPVQEAVGEEKIVISPDPEAVRELPQEQENGVFWKQVKTVLPYIWLAGSILLLGHFIYSYIVIRRRLAVCEHDHDNVYLAQDIRTPMVFGIFSPKIYVPLHLEESSLVYVLSHENMHIKRRDYITKIAAYGICMLHWFNPLVWITYHLLGSDIEKACDEAVVRSLGEDKKKEYANALLSAASGKLNSREKIFVAPICFDEGDVKGRIKNIVKYKYTVPVVGAVIVVGVLALSVMLMTKSGDDINDEVKGNSTSESISEVVEQEQTGNEPMENIEQQGEVIRVEFQDVLGYDGYYITDKTTIFPYMTSYYAVDGDNTFLIAESWNMERDDYIVDIDSDGINELICNVTWGDGAQRTIIYHRQEEQILAFDADMLLDVEFDYVGIGSIATFYRPEENVIEIFYWKEDVQDYLSKKYAIDLTSISDWRDAEYSAIEEVLKTIEISMDNGEKLTLTVIGKQDEDNGSYGVREIAVYNGENRIQSIFIEEAINIDGIYGIDEGYSQCPSKMETVELKDVNFDGFMDLEVFGWLPNNSIPYYYWCWNPDTQQFEYAFCLQLTDIDEGKEQLISWHKVENGLYHTDYYRVTADNQLELVDRQIEDARPQTPSETLSSTEEGRIEAYISVLENVFYHQIFPDGLDRGYDGLSLNKFSIHDIDFDGNEELIIVYTSTYMAGMETLIYDYDEGANAVRKEFSEFPSLTFYENGIIQAEASHNHGMASSAEDFWPYTLYQYDKETDAYQLIALVDAWELAYREEDYQGNPYPADVDVDGDGRVYYLMTSGEYLLENPIDNAEYEQCRDSYIGNAEIIRIPFMELNEEIINSLK